MNTLCRAGCILLLSVLVSACSYKSGSYKSGSYKSGSYKSGSDKSGDYKSADTQPALAWLEPGVSVTLPAPGISPAISEQQLLTGTVQGKQHSLLVLLNADQQGISIAGLSPLGIRLFLLRYDASGIHSEQHLPGAKLPPASQVLADIMLSHWPITAWQQQLPPGWTLRDTDDLRELRDNTGKLITEIHYMTRNGQRQPVALTQHAFHYHIAIQSSEN